MEAVNTDLERLIRIESNLRKAPKRIYSKNFLVSKLIEAKSIKAEIVNELVNLEDVLKSSVIDQANREVLAVSGRIFHYLELKISTACSPRYTFKNLSRLAIICNRLKAKDDTMADSFDIKTATAIVQMYDGCSQNLQTFVDGASLLKELTKPAHLEMAAKFLRTRLTGKARQGLPDNAKTIDTIVSDVETRCAEIISAQNILAKLKASGQNGNIDKFCTEVESLTTQLQNVYISQKIPGDVAKSMATKAGVDSLINGIKDNETKIVLKASTFTSVKEAIQKINENSVRETNQIFHLVGQHYNHRGRTRFGDQRGNYRGRYMNFRGAYRGQNNYHYYANRQNSNYHDRNNTQDAGNNQRNNGQGRINSENRNNFNRRGGYANNQRNVSNRNVYYSENGNRPPTPPQVGAEENQGEQIVHPRR